VEEDQLRRKTRGKRQTGTELRGDKEEE